MSKNSPHKDKEFAVRLANGDHAVIADIYDAYSATLYGIVTKILRDEDEANDVLQDAFVNIWKYGKTFDAAKSSLFTWMLNIARNKAIDRLRKIKRSGEIQNVGENVYLFETGATSALNTDTIGVSEMVAKLADDKRELIELAYFGGFTQQEVADKLNMPLGTVKTRMRAAIIEMRKYFN